MRIWLMAVALLAGAAAMGGEAVNRVKNPELTLAADGKLANWAPQGPTKNIRLSNDAETKPDGVPHSLKLEVLQADPEANDGDIRQEIKVMPETAYRVTAWLKTSVAGVGYLQVKGMGADKKMKTLATFDTLEEAAEGKEISFTFDTGDNARAFILLRYRHRNAKYEEQTAWFANVRVETAPTDK